MPEAKLSITIGALSFSGEGEQAWLASQLDKVMDKAPLLAAVSPAKRRPSDDGKDDEEQKNNGGGEVGTLASFLTAAKSGSNQVTRFLATAEWLHRKGSNRLKTSDITKALTDNNQKRLGNPADSLAKNVTKGHCERAGKEFYVTDEGRAALAVGSSGD